VLLRSKRYIKEVKKTTLPIFVGREAYLKLGKTISALVVESSGETPQKAAVDGQKLYARHKSA